MPLKKTYHNGWGAAASFYAVSEKKAGIPLIVLLPENKNIFDCAVNELSFFADVPVLAFPSYSQNPFEEVRPLPHIMSERGRTLYDMTRLDDFILVISPYGLLKKIPEPEEFLGCIVRIKKGEIFPKESLASSLDKLGYIQVEFVSGEGEYAFRGGIADIFLLGEADPVRMEYFDDEIESIFSYDIDSQGRKKEREAAEILPFSDLLINTDEFSSGLSGSLLEEKCANFGKFAGFHWLAPLFNKSSSSIFSYLKNYETACFIPELEESIGSFWDIIRANLPENAPEPMNRNFLEMREAERYLNNNNLKTITEISVSGESEALTFESSGTEFAFEKKNIYYSMTKAAERILNMLSKGIKIVFSVESDKFEAAFKEFLRDYNIIPAEIKNISDMKEAGVYIYRRRVTGGFIDRQRKLAVISDMDIFGFTKRKAKGKKREVFNTRLSDLEEGDYVVHTNYGIGIYRGIKHMVIAGNEGDFLDILYDGDDILYVPLHSINQIQKYVGLQDQKPKLNSLKSSAWQKLKKHAKESAKKIAEDLLRLYAERKAKKGFAFLDDGSFIEMFERGFEYSETEDQLSAILDVYRDMESETPMERLVCGDVGFGKTEVAMRAACKAAACGKQTAILAPTTILARQHYETFKERFKGFPVSVDFVSRFRSPKETKEIFEKAADGSLDILIGTHKILSKELEFKDLGLLVIDEEQRFGVTHKEKIASIKRNVDTLTLTATPIPRTLQLSLSGIRDMSVIETPPENRLPVAVQVIKGHEERVKAIKNELERGGQVFFLHNKVSDIEEKAHDIKNSLPHARVDFAHGQMDARTMEKILSAFYSGDIDILVATTIIENGINIPNVNTIIINNAANFGLAQLYQLKGRVGRSDKRGYCFLSVDNFSSLTEIARKRLSIIQQLSDLGSGFKIAMYDLQLRGAGNILGAEQSGFVVRIGYELYVSMIEEAVQEMKGEFNELADTEINSNIPYFIPADFMENPRIRFDFYRRFASVYDMDSMNALLKEMESGCGELRDEVINLAFIMLIKNLAGRLGAVKAVLSKSGTARITFSENTVLEPSLIGKCADKNKILYRFISEFELALSAESASFLKALSSFFENIAELSRNTPVSEDN